MDLESAKVIGAGLAAIGVGAAAAGVGNVFGSFLVCIPLQFYYACANPFLNAIGVTNAAGKMTMGQMSEIVFMLLMPWFFKRLGVKQIPVDGELAGDVEQLGFLIRHGDVRRENACF